MQNRATPLESVFASGPSVTSISSAQAATRGLEVFPQVLADTTGTANGISETKFKKPR